MKDTWYSDHRDLVKWGALVHLAKREHASTIIQVAFLRIGHRPPLFVDETSHEVAREVWDHFRDVKQIHRLGQSTGLNIVLIDREFIPRQRRQYIERTIAEINQQPAPRIVLLDPDTGLQPSKANAKHVSILDVEQTWQSLASGDWLVLYQHASRRVSWREDARASFAAACNVQCISRIEAPRIATDVAFFAAQKPSL